MTVYDKLMKSEAFVVAFLIPVGVSIATVGFGFIAGATWSTLAAFGLVIIGMIVIQLPYRYFRSQYEGLKRESEITVARNRSRFYGTGNRRQNVWVDDDDIDGDGVGGDSLTRMGITDRDN